jgi:hypothetical protein
VGDGNLHYEADWGVSPERAISLIYIRSPKNFSPHTSVDA